MYLDDWHTSIVGPAASEQDADRVAETILVAEPFDDLIVLIVPFRARIFVIDEHGAVVVFAVAADGRLRQRDADCWEAVVKSVWTVDRDAHSHLSNPHSFSDWPSAFLNLSCSAFSLSQTVFASASVE